MALRYEICGVGLVSSETFPELESSDSPDKPITIRLRREKKITAAGAVLRPAAQWKLPNGSSFLVSSKTNAGYLLHFVNLADVFIDETGSEVTYAPCAGVPTFTVRHLILDSVVALVLSLRGGLVFHASAVVTPYGACAFAATSGTGKSTLAASFQQFGHETLTDDCLLLEEEGEVIYGIPSYPGARLRADTSSRMALENPGTLSVAHYNSKRRYASGRFATARHPLAAIYSLERLSADQKKTKRPRIEPLSGHDSFVAGVRHLFCLDPQDPGFIVRQFKQLNHLLTHVPILRLTIPDDLSALPQVREAVLSDLKSRNQSAHP